MPDPEIQATNSNRWLWTALLVLLAVAVVIFVFNADGDESEFEVTDADVTTTEERLNTDLGTGAQTQMEEMEEAAEQVNGVQPPVTVGADAEPAPETTVDTQPE